MRKEDMKGRRYECMKWQRKPINAVIGKNTSTECRDGARTVSCSEINAGIACSDRANEVEPRPNEGQPNNTIIAKEDKTAESRKSIALGNAQCNELRPSLSSPERAKSFVNNRLRPVRAFGLYVFILRSALRYAIDFGLSALVRRDGARTVSTTGYIAPPPNEQSLPFTVIAKEERLKQSLTINASLGRDWLRRAPLCYGCFAEPVPNEVWGHAMTVRGGFHSAHSANYLRALSPNKLLISLNIKIL